MELKGVLGSCAVRPGEDAFKWYSDSNEVEQQEILFQLSYLKSVSTGQQISID